MRAIRIPYYTGYLEVYRMTLGFPRQIIGYLNAIPVEETISEQWCAQILAQILLRHPLILVTGFLDPELIKKMNIIPASTMEEALEIAIRLKGKEASVTVIPDGVSVIVK